MLFQSAMIKVAVCAGCSTGPAECDVKCLDEHMVMDDSTRNVNYGKHIQDSQS